MRTVGYASVGVPLPFFFQSVLPFVPSFVIAGPDPAIHAAAKLDQTFGSHSANRESPWTTGSSPVVTRRRRRSLALLPRPRAHALATTNKLAGQQENDDDERGPPGACHTAARLCRALCRRAGAAAAALLQPVQVLAGLPRP